MPRINTCIMFFSEGCVLACSFNSQQAIKQLWREHEDMLLEPVFKQHIVTSDFLKAIGARKITLRARVWQDEVDAAEREFERILVRPFTLEQRGTLKLPLPFAFNKIRRLGAHSSAP